MHGSLHHIELYVTNLAKSRDFWGWFLEKLGYSLYQEWPEGFSYMLDKTYIVFVQVEKQHLHRIYHRCGPGLNHLAFHAESRDEVDVFTRELKKRGVRILYEDRHPYAGGPDHYAVFFEDPDRMKVELVAPA